MSREYLILCGGSNLRRKGTNRSGANIIKLDVAPKTGNVHLRLRDITTRMVANLPAVAEDLVELATYVYAADQASERGSDVRFDYGTAWRRRLVFQVPVRCPEIWDAPGVMHELTRTLSFLSDDDYEFTFTRLRKARAWPEYLEYRDDADAVSGVQDVLLFSGGLDSLAGAVQEVLVGQKKVALVSHRPVSKLDARQRTLVRELADRAVQGATPFHVSVTANKTEELGRDFTQRTRSFLFASFAAVVAKLFGLDRVKFYENGVVSCNLPICAQVLGGRASRTTHPRVLHGFERLFTALFECNFLIENPFFWKTRTDVIETMRAAGHADLAAASVSCAHTWQAPTDRPHCGTCSQCVDRRLAALASRLSDDEDPKRRYRVDLLTGKLDDVVAQTMVERIVGTARELEHISGPAHFLQRFGEASRLLKQFSGRPDQVAVQLLDLHRRHAVQINGALDRELADAVRRRELGDLSPTCLLRIVAGSPSEASLFSAPSARSADLASTVFTPTEDDLKVLRALDEAKQTLIQTELAVRSDLSRGTVGDIVRNLQRWGLVYHPRGSRKGAAITDDGRALLKRVGGRRAAD